MNIGPFSAALCEDDETIMCLWAKSELVWREGGRGRSGV
jgi:hypothetical protein